MSEKKLRALATGFTTQQVGRNNRLGYQMVSHMMRDALESTGVEVDMRKVVPGEDIKSQEYDFAIIGMNSPQGLPARYLYGALWVIDQVKNHGACGGRMMFYVDDWQFRRYGQQARSQANRPHKMFDEHKRLCRVHVDEGIEHQDALVQALWGVGNEPWPLTMYPGWTWGDASMIHEAGINAKEIYKWDIMPWSLEATDATLDETAWVYDSDRRREWVLASLVDHSRWIERQKFDWPVVRYGKGTENGQLTEAEVRRTYQQSWATLGPKYPHAGCGWWRPRLLHTVEARAIFLGDPLEVGRMGPEWTVPSEAIEQMSVPELRATADAQWLSMRKWISPKEEAAAGLRAALERSFV